jgi:hypothetical protein
VFSDASLVRCSTRRSSRLAVPPSPTRTELTRSRPASLPFPRLDLGNQQRPANATWSSARLGRQALGTRHSALGRQSFALLRSHHRTDRDRDLPPKEWCSRGWRPVARCAARRSAASGTRAAARRRDPNARSRPRASGADLQGELPGTAHALRDVRGGAGASLPSRATPAATRPVGNPFHPAAAGRRRLR